MTQNNEPTAENFFDNVGGGGAPSAKLSDVNDFVLGTVVDQRVVDVRPFGGKEGDVEHNKDGSIRKQLVLTLETDLRNWSGVAKVPDVDRDDLSKGKKDPSEDDGKRAVYLPQWSNIQAAVADAIRKQNAGKNGPVANGAKVGIKVIELKDVGKGNPLKIHAAHYEAPTQSAGFFDSAPATEAAPAAAAAPATAAPEAPAAPATAAPAQQDPWGTPAAGGDEPPF